MTLGTSWDQESDAHEAISRVKKEEKDPDRSPEKAGNRSNIWTQSLHQDISRPGDLFGFAGGLETQTLHHHASPSAAQPQGPEEPLRAGAEGGCDRGSAARFEPTIQRRQEDE